MMILRKIRSTSAIILAGCMLLVLSACGAKEMVNAPVNAPDQSYDNANSNSNNLSQVDDTEAIADEGSVSQEEMSGDQNSDKSVEPSTAKKLWRVYKLDQEDSSIDGYLYQIDDNTGEIIDSYDEFIFESEDVLD